jgi:hypothetical protein
MARKDGKPMSDHTDWAARLVHDDFLSEDGNGVLCTTQRWHGALARAALRLYQRGDELADIRTPITAALLEAYDDESDGAVAQAVETMYKVALRELNAAARFAGLELKVQ